MLLSRTPASGFLEPCLPSTAERPPSGPDWVHEIKHDVYRLMARRDPVGIRLLTRNGHHRCPLARSSQAQRGPGEGRALLRCGMGAIHDTPANHRREVCKHAGPPQI
jgi:hypothetical protein